MTKNNRSAFTLAEMMIVMLILTILLAAFAPLMTKKSKVDLSNPWRWAANNSDIYYGVGNNQTALIGQNSKANTDPNAKFLINSSKAIDSPHITFKEGNNNRGHLMLYNDNILLGTANTGLLGQGANVLIGRNIFKEGNFYNNNKSNVIIGAGAASDTSRAEYSVIIGSGANLVPRPNDGKNYADDNLYNVIIGNDSIGHMSHNTVIGYGANRTNGLDQEEGLDFVTAIGYQACAGNLKQYVTKRNNYSPAVTCIGAVSGPNTPGYAWDYVDSYVYIGSALGNNQTFIRGRLNVDTLFVAGEQVTSDKRLKNIKNESTYGLKEIKQLKVYNYVMKDSKEKTPRMGIMAQDLQKVIPDAVSKDYKKYLTINPEYITYSMLNAIKELDKMVQDLVAQVKTIAAQVAEHDKQIKALQKENKELKTKINNLEKRLNAIEKKL